MSSPGISAKPLILVVIDGLTPAMLERGFADRRLPALGHLATVGTYTRGTTVFPSLTPVCLTSIATGAHPDIHHVPHLAWYKRDERRIVEYGSSFAAMRAVGARRSMRDSIFNMSGAHVSAGATTVFEALEDAGITPAAINFTCYRGRTRHRIRLPALAAKNRWYEAAYGPRRFFFFNLFESDLTGAPLAVRSRVDGSIDAYAAAVGRWLVTRDGFDFLVFYLPDYDYASHAVGPEAAAAALERADESLGVLMDAAGGPDAFLDRYAVLVCSDHGQSASRETARLERAFPDLRVYAPRRAADPEEADVVVTASNRAGMVYRTSACRASARELAERLDAEPAAATVLFREDGIAVARGDGVELRFERDGDGWATEGPAGVLDPVSRPRGLERAWHALACPTAGDVLVSAREGWEFTDLGGGHHVGGGSHGSLSAADSTVPFLSAGFEDAPLPDEPSVTDLAPAVLRHFSVPLPPSMRQVLAARA